MLEIKLNYSLGLKILHVVSTLKIVYDLIMISEIRNLSPSSGFLVRFSKYVIMFKEICKGHQNSKKFLSLILAFFFPFFFSFLVWNSEHYYHDLDLFLTQITL